jgi:hypothetical protein
MNDHLIVLPLNHFKGMPESIAKLLGAQSNSTSKITLAQGDLENTALENESLDEKVKRCQDENYRDLLQWKDTHGLQLDSQNYL